MPRVTRSASVRVPATRAYDYLKTGTHVKDWIPDVSRSENATPGPVHVGSRVVFAFRVAGHDFDITNEITQLREPDLVGFRAVTGVANQGRFEIEPLSPGSCRVTLHFAFELPHGPVGALARFLPVDRIIDRYAERSIARLVARLESLEPAPSEESSADSATSPATNLDQTGEPL